MPSIMWWYLVKMAGYLLSMLQYAVKKNNEKQIKKGIGTNLNACN